MPFNLISILVSAFTTFIIGFIWYHPKIFGTLWMIEAGLTEEKMKNGNMLKIFGLTFFYSLLFASAIPQLTIHQMGPLGMIGGPDKIPVALPSYMTFMSEYGNAFRTFKHGALHGFLSGIFLALPIIAINGLFEQKSWKYIAIIAGYWIVTMTIIGGIICAWK